MVWGLTCDHGYGENQACGGGEAEEENRGMEDGSSKVWQCVG